MKTTHSIYYKSSSEMNEIPDESIELVITSPPYPMIEMWDSLFGGVNEEIKEAFDLNDGIHAFELIHSELNSTWREIGRVVVPGGIVCINIGDATRKIGDTFQLYSNHVKIAEQLQRHGFTMLPSIIWRKPTNSPNKFLGSGMIPPNAYITLEHEYILLFRKGKIKRVIPPKSSTRYNSAYFWEERNKWFSDLWTDILGSPQNMNSLSTDHNLRERSAAFPLEIPYRLINMFSLYGDTVLDPFWGTGTTSLAAMILARNSIGYEINAEFKKTFELALKNMVELNQFINHRRFNDHNKFVENYMDKGKQFKYHGENYDTPVFTKQERKFILYSTKSIKVIDDEYQIEYKPFLHENN